MSQEEQNLQTVQNWMNLYNTDPTRMVTDCYTPDCVVECMGLLTINGRDEFIKIEEDVLAAVPDRTFRIDHSHAVGDKVIAEAVLTFTGSAGEKVDSHFCAVLTFKDGKIATDRTYLDQTNWPGLA